MKSGNSAVQNRLADILLITGFITMLVCPLVVFLLSDDQPVSASENRKLASAPTWATLIKDPPRFRREFESYLKDQIGFREAAIELDSKIKILAFNISPSPLAIIGRDRWIYFWGPNSRKQTAKRDFRGDYRIPLAELDRWYLNHMAIVDDLKRRGVDYLLVIAPNKQSIHPEHLPFRTRRKAGQTILDQYAAYLSGKEVEGWLNLKPAFLGMKNQKQLYVRSDSHWNENGYLYAYRTIVDWSRQDVPSIPAPKPDSELDFRPELRRGDLVHIVGFASYFMESITSVYARDPCASIKEDIPLQEYGYTERDKAYLYRCKVGAGKTLFVHDSFGIPVEGLLAEHYAEMLASHKGSPLELDQLVSRFNPDFFVHLRVERELSSLFPENPELTNRYVAKLFNNKKDQRLIFDLDRANLQCSNCRTLQQPAGVMVESTSNDPNIAFTRSPSKEFSKSVTIKLEITAATADTAKIYYTTSADPDFSERQSVSTRLIAGKNTRFLRVVAGYPLISFRLDPGVKTSTYLLHELSLVNNGRN